MFPMRSLLVLLGTSSALAAPTRLGLDASTLANVRSKMMEIATHSWELGTEAETLLELESPDYSVFSRSLHRPPTRIAANSSVVDVISLAERIVEAQPADSLPLIDGDGAVGDPASLGVPVLLANWTRTNQSDDRFSVAAEGQLKYLLEVAPRNSDGAISHREEQVQLWADFVYMAPPFIAYFGALSDGDDAKNILRIAYDQCRLYRDNLRVPEAGLWKHIVLGDWQDNTLWGTGNAWAAAGMLRVLETIRRSPHSHRFEREKIDLASWTQEIIDNSWKYQQTNGTLLNALDDPASFADSSSTALLAATTYRLAALTGDLSHIPAANKAFKVIKESIDEDGWLLNTVDPFTFNTPSKPGEHSPEGQAFALLLHAAWRDYNES
ncbi:Six-hairpin glycosidase [Panus rudis PR-1116 ss-1]|nr:Six-hairpin glycosidase [Panus rudis PR-1116 ss-1]